MRTLIATLLAASCLAGAAHAAAPLIYEGDINMQGKPMAARGRAQWALDVKVGNTGRVKLNTYSGTNVFNPSTYTVTFHAGPTRSDAGQIEIACNEGNSYIEFTFATNNLAYDFEKWYSSLKFVSGSTIVSQPEGYLSTWGAPEVDGGSQSFTYNRNWSLWSFSNGGSGPTIGDGSTIQWTTNAGGQIVLQAISAAITNVDHGGLSGIEDDDHTNYVTHAEGDADYQPLEATLTDIADGTIAENLVNTANPWADNEVANNLTVDDAGIAATITRDIEWDTRDEVEAVWSGTTIIWCDDNDGAASTLDADLLDGESSSAYSNAVNLYGDIAAARMTVNAPVSSDFTQNGGVLVGTGAGTFQEEAGDALRTSIGVGTNDSPHLTGIELGHPTDTTLTRVSAGNMNIEGNLAYRAGGTDVPVTDGGSGASTFTDGSPLLGSGTGAFTAPGVMGDGEVMVGDGSGDPVYESGATLRTSVGVAIGSDVQAYDAQLTEWAGVSTGDYYNSTVCDTLFEVQLNNEAGLYAVLSDVTNFLQAADLNTFSELDAMVADKTLVNEEDAVTWDNTQTFNGIVDIATNNITYVPAGANIDTAVANATAGDCLVLAAATYTITDDIDVTKSIAIYGQGEFATIISTTTDDKNVFHVTASDVEIGHLGISVTASNTFGVYVTGVAGTVLDDVFLHDLDIVLNSHAGAQHAVRYVDAGGEIKAVELTATSTDESASGIWMENESTAEAATELHAHLCNATVVGAGGIAGGYRSYNDSASQDCTLKLFYSRACVTEGAACTSAGAAAYNGTNAKLVAEHCFLKATDYDALQANGATFTMRNCALAAGATTGTITFDGYLTPEGIDLGDDSDTTLTRASAGELAVEGTQLAKLDGGLQDLDTLGAASSNGEFIVATGAGALAWESGATARTSLGLVAGGTGDIWVEKAGDAMSGDLGMGDNTITSVNDIVMHGSVIVATNLEGLVLGPDGDSTIIFEGANTRFETAGQLDLQLDGGNVTIGRELANDASPRLVLYGYYSGLQTMTISSTSNKFTVAGVGTYDFDGVVDATSFTGGAGGLTGNAPQTIITNALDHLSKGYAGTDNSGQNFIQDIQVDANGVLTNVVSAAATGGSGGTVTTNWVLLCGFGDWEGEKVGSGAGTNNAVVWGDGYGTFAASNNIGGECWYSTAAALQDRYYKVDAGLPGKMSRFGPNGLRVVMRSSSTNPLVNKVDILFDDGQATDSLTTMASLTADAFREYSISESDLPASWSNAVPTVTLGTTAMRMLMIRATAYTSTSNTIQAAVFAEVVEE